MELFLVPFNLPVRFELLNPLLFPVLGLTGKLRVVESHKLDAIIKILLTSL